MLAIRPLKTIGLMSGTSLDGVDAAWVETDGESVSRLGPAVTLPYAPELRRDLRLLLDAAPGLSADDPWLEDVVRRLTERHAEAVIKIRDETHRQWGEGTELLGFHGLLEPTDTGEPLGRPRGNCHHVGSGEQSRWGPPSRECRCGARPQCH